MFLKYFFKNYHYLTFLIIVSQDQSNVLSNVKQTLLVMSGKGGVGNNIINFFFLKQFILLLISLNFTNYDKTIERLKEGRKIRDAANLMHKRGYH